MHHIRQRKNAGASELPACTDDLDAFAVEEGSEAAPQRAESRCSRAPTWARDAGRAILGSSRRLALVGGARRSVSGAAALVVAPALQRRRIPAGPHTLLP